MNNPSRHGAAAVELALILPLYMVLVLGCTDFGRFAFTYIAVTNAARNAAAYAAKNYSETAANWATNTTNAAVDEMSQLSGFNKSLLTVSNPTAGITADPSGDGRWKVSVTVTYPFQTIISYPGMPSKMTLSRTVVAQGG